MNAASDTALVAYVASPHDGYLQLFRAYHGARLFILGGDIIAEFSSLTKHLPGNKPEDARVMIEALGIFSSVCVVGKGGLDRLCQFVRVVMPDEDVAHAIAERYLPDAPVVFDSRWRLRWYRDTVTVGSRPEGEEVITAEVLDRRLMREAIHEGEQSSDWWRQIGALLVREGRVILATHNAHRPSEQSAYLLGDPRSQFGPGEHIELSLSGHAEATLAARALHHGISTKGCDLYVSTFPCPPCAYFWAESGIRRLYYRDGYSLVEGSADLRAHGIEIIRVIPDDPSPSG